MKATISSPFISHLSKGGIGKIMTTERVQNPKAHACHSYMILYVRGPALIVLVHAPKLRKINEEDEVEQ